MGWGKGDGACLESYGEYRKPPYSRLLLLNRSDHTTARACGMCTEKKYPDRPDPVGLYVRQVFCRTTAAVDIPLSERIHSTALHGVRALKLCFTLTLKKRMGCSTKYTYCTSSSQVPTEFENSNATHRKKARVLLQYCAQMLRSTSYDFWRHLKQLRNHLVG